MQNTKKTTAVVKTMNSNNVNAKETIKTEIFPSADGKSSIIRTTRTRVVKIIRKLIKKPDRGQ